MKHRFFASLAALSAAASLAVAQAPAGVRGEILHEFDFAANRVMQLAEKMTQEQYAWRPGAGVRSVSEVLVHFAAGGPFLASLGGAPAFALPNNPEKTVTDKAQVLDLLKRTTEHVRQSLRNTTDADLDKPATLFGRPTTVRGVWLLVAAHAHEHLGQLIAYARTNNVVPPWSN